MKAKPRLVALLARFAELRVHRHLRAYLRHILLGTWIYLDRRDFVDWKACTVAARVEERPDGGRSAQAQQLEIDATGCGRTIGIGTREQYFNIMWIRHMLVMIVGSSSCQIRV